LRQAAEARSQRDELAADLANMEAQAAALQSEVEARDKQQALAEAQQVGGFP
jgi:hypothetical protein